MKKNKKKMYLRLSLMSVFFVIVSFISGTLAWFVYSGLSKVQTEVNVKAWYIEMEGEKDENGLIINVDDIYPGMQPKVEEIKIKNFGDSDAQLNYTITNARVLNDDYTMSETLSSEYIEDVLAHQYPFHINIDLSKRFVLAKTDETVFKVTVSWPLDSGNDARDSSWGTKAYQFKLNEEEQDDLNSDYDKKSPIRLTIDLTAEQYLGTETSSDIKYRLGNEILYDVVLDMECETESATCLRTNVIDINNTIGDNTVTLLPKLTYNYLETPYISEDSLKLDGYNIVTLSNNNTNYISESSLNLGGYSVENNWKAETRILNILDILKIVSKDIDSSVIKKDGISDLVIGNLNYPNRKETILNSVKEQNAYFVFLNKFMYLQSNSCYWVNDIYNEEQVFAVEKNDADTYKIYGKNKTENCKIIPVIIAKK